MKINNRYPWVLDMNERERTTNLKRFLRLLSEENESIDIEAMSALELKEACNKFASSFSTEHHDELCVLSSILITVCHNKKFSDFCTYRSSLLNAKSDLFSFMHWETYAGNATVLASAEFNERDNARMTFLLHEYQEYNSFGNSVVLALHLKGVTTPEFLINFCLDDDHMKIIPTLYVLVDKNYPFVTQAHEHAYEPVEDMDQLTFEQLEHLYSIIKHIDYDRVMNIFYTLIMRFFNEFLPKMTGADMIHDI